jgi:3-ketosteroid 9alpha-monooxygenase subunit B
VAVVTSLTWETREAASFGFCVPSAKRARFTARAGQYVTVGLDTEQGWLARCYSLSSCHEIGEPSCFTVKRVPGGAMSNLLLDGVRPGDKIRVSPPAGRFVLDYRDLNRPLVCFAAGSGITPIFSLVKAALATTARSVGLFYANRDSDSTIFYAALAALVAKYPSRFTIHQHYDRDLGFVSAADVTRFLAEHAGARLYLCGPESFMNLVEGAVVHWPEAADLIVERFVSPATDAPSMPGEVSSGPCRLTIILNGHTRHLTWNGTGHLLDAVLGAGLAVPFSCRHGHCGTCLARLVEGEVKMKWAGALSARDRARGLILPCQAIPTSDAVIVDFDV